MGNLANTLMCDTDLSTVKNLRWSDPWNEIVRKYCEIESVHINIYARYGNDCFVFATGGTQFSEICNDNIRALRNNSSINVHTGSTILA